MALLLKAALEADTRRGSGWSHVRYHSEAVALRVADLKKQGKNPHLPQILSPNTSYYLRRKFGMCTSTINQQAIQNPHREFVSDVGFFVHTHKHTHTHIMTNPPPTGQRRYP